MISYPPYEALLASIPVREREVSVLGSQTRYWEYGPSDSDVVVVVAHGFRGEHHGLEPVVAHLQGVRVVAPDLPGFGESPPLATGEHSVEGYARWFTAFVDELGLRGKAVILGHSFGSIVASKAVAEGLETPRLILINPIAASALEGPNAFLTRLTVLFYRVGAALPLWLGSRLLANSLVVRLMSVMMSKTRNAELRRWIHDQHDTYFSRFAHPRMLGEAFRASISGSVGSVAGRLHVPTLLVGARQDPITRVSDLVALSTAIPDATLTVLDNVGHLIHYERPHEAAAHVVAFLGAGRVVGTPT